MSFPLLATLQLTTEGIIWQIVTMSAFIAFLLLWNKVQPLIWLNSVRRDLLKIEVMLNQALGTSIETAKRFTKADPGPQIKRLIEHSFIEPTDLDPSGIVWKLDHLLDVREERFEDEVKAIAPDAPPSELNNLKNLIEATLSLNTLYKVVRHYYLLGRRTKSSLIIMQIYMLMPLIMQIAEAYLGAVTAFSKGYPVGDGAGAMVAASLMRGAKVREMPGDMVVAEKSIKKRRVFILKSKGPGGNVGKPGDALRELIERLGGKVSMIVMVDAQLKFEGERTGEISEGTGAAIGGIGTEKYKIEEVSVKYRIPLYAVLIKESIQEAISPMKEDVVEGVRKAVEAVKRVIVERTKEGDVVLVAGIGNTIGIGQ